MSVPSLIGVSISLALTFALGHSLLVLMARNVALWWFERAALAFVLGTGAACLALLSFVPLYRFVDPRWVLVMVACAGVAATRGTRRLPRAEWGAVSAVAVVGGGVLAVQFAALIVTALHTPLGWDGLFNFEFKARLAFEHQVLGQFPLAYFSDSTRTWSHPGYPLLLPSAEFWIYSWMGRVDQASIKILFPLFFAAMVAFASGTIRRLAGARAAMACAIALGLVPALTMGPGAITGYADVPMAAAAIGAVSCTILALETDRFEAFVLAGVLSAIAAWTKIEGLVIAAYVGCAAVTAAAWLGRRKRSAVVSALTASVVLWIPLLAVLPWLAFTRYYGMPEADFPSLSPAVALRHLDRLPFVLHYEVRALLRPGRWGLIWPAFAAAAAWSIWRRDVNLWTVFLAGSVIVPLSAYTCAYLFSAWPNWPDHVATSFERLLTPLAPLALVFSVYRIWMSLERSPSEAPAGATG